MSSQDTDPLEDNLKAEASCDEIHVHRLKGVKDGQYSNPVYKKLSVINGEINRMTRDDLIHRLEDLHLDSRYRF